MKWRRNAFLDFSPRALALAACIACAAQFLPAQGDALDGGSNPELEIELLYVSGLRELRMFDYAFK